MSNLHFTVDVPNANNLLWYFNFGLNLSIIDSLVMLNVLRLTFYLFFSDVNAALPCFYYLQM